jgi:hypothetical protein
MLLTMPILCCFPAVSMTYRSFVSTANLRIEQYLRVRPIRRAQKRKGDFSREISPSLFRLSEIWFGFQITTLVTPESFGTHEPQPVFYLTLL